jgi:hypothetical protein
MWTMTLRDFIIAADSVPFDLKRIGSQPTNVLALSREPIGIAASIWLSVARGSTAAAPC